jgi:hypothetical protein
MESGGKRIRRHAEVIELLAKNLTGCNGTHLVSGHRRLPSTVVHDFDVVRITCVPTKTQPPLIIDPDRVLPLAVTLERFESISRQPTQIIERACRLENCELALGLSPECSEGRHC